MLVDGAFFSLRRRPKYSHERRSNERTNGLKFKFPFSRLTIETSLFNLKLHLKVLDKSWAQMSSNRRNENAVPLDPQKLFASVAR